MIFKPRPKRALTLVAEDSRKRSILLSFYQERVKDHFEQFGECHSVGGGIWRLNIAREYDYDEVLTYVEQCSELTAVGFIAHIRQYDGI